MSSTFNPSINWLSAGEPRVTIDNTWVCPLLNNPEPCTLGRRPASAESGLISFISLPSGLILSIEIILLTSFFIISSILLWISSSVSGKSSKNFSLASSSILKILSSLSVLSVVLIDDFISSSKFSEISLSSSVSWYSSTSFLGRPISSIIVWMKSETSPISSRASNIASSISLSSSSFAPASTMLIAPFLPATVRSKSDFFLSSSFGFTTSFPSTFPTMQAPTGPSNGMSEIPRAIEAPIVVSGSGRWSWSIDRTVAMICTSL